MAYKVIVTFSDLEDNGHLYKAGDTYPRNGVSPTEDRVEFLSSNRNLIGKPVIEKVEEAKEAKEVANWISRIWRRCAGEAETRQKEEVMITLTALCREVNNWFERARFSGLFHISNGEIDLSQIESEGGIKDGQYFRIIGSVFNDGVHRYGAEDDILEDETFTGIVAPMAVPKDFMALFNEISAWLTANLISRIKVNPSGGIRTP